MIPRPPGVGVFQFVVLSSLRAAQLMRGCPARVDGMHKAIVIAQLEVAEGKVTQISETSASGVAELGEVAGEPAPLVAPTP